MAAVPASAQGPVRLSKDLREISNLKSVGKTITFQAAHRDALYRNGFFTTPSEDPAMYWVYGTNDYRDIPSLVTVDNVLQIYHVFFESALRGAEEKGLYPEVENLTRSLLRKADQTYRAQKGTPLEGAALKNVAYLSVAARLLGQEVIPSEGKDLAERELAKIQSANGRERSAIFPYDLDYSQFIVRGHYTRNEKLQRYFRTMMWFGLAPFAAKSASGAILTEQVQQGLLLSDDLLNSDAKARWQKVYEVTSLFAGRSNNLTPDLFAKVARKHFSNSKEYANPGRLKVFVADLEKLPRPAIVAKLKEGINPGPVQLKLMGQRAIPDSAILQALVDSEKRPFPSPLDVMAVLGSPSAQKILDAGPKTYNPKSWKDYLPARKRLQVEFSRKNSSTWGQDLYWSWLDSLRSTIGSVPSNYPSFMKGDAWNRKALYSALASWAELRHDTILYGEQTVAEMGDGEEPAVIKGYVEPNVVFYKRMLALMDQTSNGLKKNGYLTKAMSADFSQARKLIEFLAEVSEKELAGKKLSKQEYNRIRFIEGEIEAANTSIQMTATGYQTLSDSDRDMALVADVHTALGQALTVGVGRADHIFAVVPIEGKWILTRGSSLSYYEFVVPANQRLTDEAWKKRLAAGKMPPRPLWIRDFFVPVPPKVKSD